MLNILFLMDDFESINTKKDSTYLLINACFEFGLTPYFIKNMSIQEDQLVTTCYAFKESDTKAPLSVINEPKILSSPDIHAIWLRKDPPVNESYITDMLMLNCFRNDIHFFNNPMGILLNNEKLSATQFPTITPPTTITSTKETIRSFINTHKNAVIKPLDGYGGQGIFKLHEQDTNFDTIVEMATKKGTCPIVCQQALQHELGDKRILLLDGEPIGAVKRRNPSGHRNNFMSGGQAEPDSITSNDFVIIDTIKDFLKSNGLFFVGIDIIEDHLIEINVTSPTGIQEINYFNDAKLHLQIISAMKTQILE